MKDLPKRQTKCATRVRLGSLDTRCAWLTRLDRLDRRHRRRRRHRHHCNAGLSVETSMAQTMSALQLDATCATGATPVPSTFPVYFARACYSVLACVGRLPLLLLNGTLTRPRPRPRPHPFVYAPTAMHARTHTRTHMQVRQPFGPVLHVARDIVLQPRPPRLVLMSTCVGPGPFCTISSFVSLYFCFTNEPRTPAHHPHTPHLRTRRDPNVYMRLPNQ